MNLQFADTYWLIINNFCCLLWIILHFTTNKIQIFRAMNTFLKALSMLGLHLCRDLVSVWKGSFCPDPHYQLVCQQLQWPCPSTEQVDTPRPLFQLPLLQSQCISCPVLQLPCVLAVEAWPCKLINTTIKESHCVTLFYFASFIQPAGKLSLKFT